jgi:hypothetical protein
LKGESQKKAIEAKLERRAQDGVFFFLNLKIENLIFFLKMKKK